MALWGEGFHKIYPSVQIEIEGKGSSTAPTALIENTAHFGPMSREMKQGEIDKFEGKFGYKPTALRSSIDMLAVYVHKDNPINKLTLEQLDRIFGAERTGGWKGSQWSTEAARDSSGNIRTWGRLGLAGDWAAQPIHIFGTDATQSLWAGTIQKVVFKVLAMLMWLAPIFSAVIEPPGFRMLTPSTTLGSDESFAARSSRREWR